MNAGVINFAVYENGSEFLGLAKVTFPDSANKTFTVNGAGIAGDVDIPVVGHKDAMRVTFDFTDNSEAAHKLSEERRHLIDCRVAHEEYDSTAGRIVVKAYKHILDIMPITQSGGDVAPASAQGTTVECTVFSRKDYIDGKLVRHYEPLKFIDIDASGTNRLAEVQSALGK
jgi:phage tail tube protein FII